MGGKKLWKPEEGISVVAVTWTGIKPDKDITKSGRKGRAKRLKGKKSRTVRVHVTGKRHGGEGGKVERREKGGAKGCQLTKRKMGALEGELRWRGAGQGGTEKRKGAKKKAI